MKKRKLNQARKPPSAPRVRKRQKPSEPRDPPHSPAPAPPLVEPRGNGASQFWQKQAYAHVALTRARKAADMTTPCAIRNTCPILKIIRNFEKSQSNLGVTKPVGEPYDDWPDLLL